MSAILQWCAKPVRARAASGAAHSRSHSRIGTRALHRRARPPSPEPTPAHRKTAIIVQPPSPPSSPLRIDSFPSPPPRADSSPPRGSGLGGASGKSGSPGPSGSGSDRLVLLDVTVRVKHRPIGQQADHARAAEPSLAARARRARNSIAARPVKGHAVAQVARDAVVDGGARARAHEPKHTRTEAYTERPRKTRTARKSASKQRRPSFS